MASGGLGEPALCSDYKWTPGCPWTSHWPSLVPGSRVLGVGCWPQSGAGLEGEAFGATQPCLTPQTWSKASRGCQCPAKTLLSAFTTSRLPPLLSLAFLQGPEQRLLPEEKSADYMNFHQE